MASRNYLVISNDLTATERRGYRLTALAAGLERCTTARIGNIDADVPGLAQISPDRQQERVNLIKGYINTGKWPGSIDQRELAPLTDLVAPTALDSWLTAALAVIGAFYSCTQAIAAPQLNVGLLMVCYGVSVDSAVVPMPVSRLLFRRGGAAGNIQAQFDMEQMGVRLETDAFFSEPVVIDPNEIFAIQVRARAIAGATIVHIHNFVFEASGNTIA